MTVVCSGDDDVLEQITKQLNKLVDVRDIKILEPDASVIRELILVKVRVSQANRQNVTSIAEIFRAKVVDVSVDSMVLELTGSKSKLEHFSSFLQTVMRFWSWQEPEYPDCHVDLITY